MVATTTTPTRRLVPIQSTFRHAARGRRARGFLAQLCESLPRPENCQSGEFVPSAERRKRVERRAVAVAVGPELEVELAELRAGVPGLAHGADAVAGVHAVAVAEGCWRLEV